MLQQEIQQNCSQMKKWKSDNKNTKNKETTLVPTKQVRVSI